MRSIEITFEAYGQLCWFGVCVSGRYVATITLDKPLEKRQIEMYDEDQLKRLHGGLTFAELSQVVRATRTRQVHSSSYESLGSFVHTGDWRQLYHHNNLRKRGQSISQGILVKEAYPFSKPYATASSVYGKLLVIWIGNENTTDGSPGTIIKYNVFDANQQAFLHTLPLDLDDAIPSTGRKSSPTVQLLADQKTVAVTWSQFGPYEQLDGTPITNSSDEAQLGSYLLSAEIKFATYDLETSTWSAAQTLTNNQVMDTNAQLSPIPTVQDPSLYSGAETHKAMATWFSTSNPMEASSATGDIMYAWYDGTSWSAAAKLGVVINMQDVYAVAASEHYVVLAYSQVLDLTRTVGYLRYYDIAAGEWSATRFDLVFDQSVTVGESKINQPSISYTGNDEFLVAFVVDGALKSRIFSPKWLDAYMEENYPINNVSKSLETVSMYSLVPIISYNGSYAPTYTTFIEWVSNLVERQDVSIFTSTFVPTSGNFSEPTFTRRSNNTMLAHRIVVASTKSVDGMF